MGETGTYTFTDPGDFEAATWEARVDLLLTRPGKFLAQLTRIALPRLHLLRAEEELPRIARVAPMPEPAVVAFPTRFRSRPIWSGIALEPLEIVFHGPGARMYQRTGGPGGWALVSLARGDLAAWGHALADVDLVPPPTCLVLRPPPADASRLLRLHAQAGRLAETKPDLIAHSEVARALEQELVHALVNCLALGAARTVKPASGKHAKVIERLEEVLAAHPGCPMHVPELCMAVGVPERTLRACCEEFLGMGPQRYLRLRRMKTARGELQRADPATTSVATIARQCGFADLGRFAVTYRTWFGETPSTTLRGGSSRAH